MSKNVTICDDKRGLFQGVTYFSGKIKILEILLTYVENSVTLNSYKAYKNNMK